MTEIVDKTQNVTAVTPKIDDCEKLLLEMLTENTGSHFLDSGGAYGRAWQKNQKDGIETLKNQPEIKIDYDYVSISLFHYLNTNLTIDDKAKELQKEFEEFSELEENKNSHWLGLMKEFSKGYTIYTYNSENCLSQIIQYTFIYDYDYEEVKENENYILLQIHGGCDVRGGYTAPKVFKVIDQDDFQLDINKYSVRNDKFDLGFDTYDAGYHYEPFGNGNEENGEDKTILIEDGVMTCEISLCNSERINIHYNSVFKRIFAKLRSRFGKPKIIMIELKPFVCWF